jgi:hypothetical protein
MRRMIVKGGALAAALAVCAGLVWACADIGYDPNWALAAPQYNPLGRPVISPGNDTRINLLLILRSLAGRSIGAGAPAAAQSKAGETGRHVNYDDVGGSFFTWESLRQTYWPETPDAGGGEADDACARRPEAMAALTAALTEERGLPDRDRQLILARRAKLTCPSAEASGEAVSAAGGEYLAYLKAAADFYQGDWELARTGFAGLRHAKSAWVAETAAYMPIRIALRAATEDAVDQWGGFEGVQKVDQEEVAAARAGIAAYLRDYPRGRYAESARNLMRRVMWLAGENVALARTYEQALREVSLDAPGAADLIEEIDRRILMEEEGMAAVATARDAPILQAVVDLERMRVDESGKPMALTGTELAAQAGTFGRAMDLYAYLRGTRAWYAGEDAAVVLDLTPAIQPTGARTSLDFSRVVLRGMALAKRADPSEAGYWTAAIRAADPLFEQPFAQLGLAIRWENDGRLDKVFAPDSPVTDRRIREVLLENVAPPDILRKVSRDATRTRHERETAQFTLLYNDLARGAYAAFAADIALVAPDAKSAPEGPAGDGLIPITVGKFTAGTWSDGFGCPEIRRTATTLARTPDDARALLCLGDFYRLNGFDQVGRGNTFPKAIAPGRPHEVLGEGPDLFPGRIRFRETIYNAIIANRRADPDMRAYALYRAVRCYAPGGNNSCGPAWTGASAEANQGVPISQRRAWYEELKQKYPDSRWAKALRYYW